MQRSPEDVTCFWLGHANKTITDAYCMIKEDNSSVEELQHRVDVGFEISARLFQKTTDNCL
jgi:hypothetical protein